MAPFHLRYDLTRRHRLAVELTPWLPCLAACLGFAVGVTYLAAVVSRWFVLLLVLPPFVYRGFFGFLFGIVARATTPVDIVVEDDRLGVLTGGERVWLRLGGVIQVYRSEDRSTWTVLHLNGSVLTIPAGAITADQLDHLKGFALRAAAARRAAHPVY